MEYILLCLSISLGALKNVFTKLTKTGSNNLLKMSRVNSFTFTMAFFVTYIFYISHNGFILKTPFWMSTVYALCTLLGQISLMVAVSSGSVAISSLFYSCGFIIPTIWGSCYYEEGLSFLRIVGVLIILVSFALSTNFKDKQALSLKWLLAAIGGLVFSGIVGITQKLFMKEYSEYSLDGFLSVAFLMIVGISSCLGLGELFVRKIKQTKPNSVATPSLNITHEQSRKRKIDRKIIIFTVCLGLVIGFANKLNTYLSGVFPSMVCFPSINGGTIVATTLVSMIFFKEKLTKLQIVGIIVGFIGILLVAVA